MVKVPTPDSCEPFRTTIYPKKKANDVIHELSRQFGFDVWKKNNRRQNTIRLITSWATKHGAVKAFLEAYEEIATD